MKGIDWRNADSYVTPAIFDPTIKVIPTGGVMLPRLRASSITTAKCKGSNPSWTIAGARAGAAMTIAGKTSINMPKTIKRAFTTII